MSQHELETKVRQLIREVLQGFVDKLSYLNTGLTKHGDELGALDSRIIALEHKALYFDERYDQLREQGFRVESEVQRFNSGLAGCTAEAARREKHFAESLARTEQELLVKSEGLQFLKGECEMNRNRTKDLQSQLLQFKTEGDQRVKKFIGQNIEVNVAIQNNYVLIEEQAKSLSRQFEEIKAQLFQSLQNFELFVQEKKFISDKLEEFRRGLDLKSDIEDTHKGIKAVARDCEQQIFELTKRTDRHFTEKQEQLKQLRRRTDSLQDQHLQSDNQIRCLQEARTALQNHLRELQERHDLGYEKHEIELRSLEAKTESMEDELKDREEERNKAMRQEMADLESLIMLVKSDIIARTEEKLSKLNDVIFSSGDKQFKDMMNTAD